MSDNIVEITQTSDYIISIDTSLVQNDNNVDVTVSSPNIVDVINNTTVLISDLPPGYPISSTSGYLPISRVSGLDILAGTGIGVINNSGLYTISVTGTFGLTGEQVDDRISNLLVAGNYINISYNDNLDSLTISASGLQPTGNYSLVGHSHIISDISGLQTQLDSKQPSGVYASGIHTHTSSQIIDFNEAVDDRIGSGLFVSGSGINLIYNDTSNSFTVSASGLINNPANNRILTSRDTTTINIDAESNLTFDGTSLVVSGDARVDNIKFDGNTISTISGNISINPFSSGSIQRGLITSVPGFIRGPYAVDFSVISSSGRVASGPYSVICGGIANKASHSFAIVGGGNTNSATGPYSSVVGGIENTSAGTYNFVGGGQNNTCSGPYSASILGGRNNTTSGYYSTIGGGANNNSAGRSSVVAGGGGNTSSAYYSTIGGGYSNTSSAIYSTVGGGLNNTAGGNYSVIGGGSNNTVLGNFSAILAGSYNNDNSFNNVFILGSNITATQANTTYTQNLISQSGQFTNLTVNNTGVSLMGHTHTSINITDFNSSVSGLLPVKNITSGSGIGISSVSGNFTVSVTGTFGLTGEQVDDRVNDLLKAGSYINLNYNDLGDALTISVTGLQPSGNYSVVGHTHTSSNITDFNTAVSGLIPPSSFTSLSGISGITVSNSGTNYTVSLTDPTIQLVDITDLSNNAQTFLLTPSSNNLSSLINDETGSGLLVFNNSPSFSGIPTAPTASSGTNTNQIASTSFVRTEISNLVNSAPSTLDTLNELATALGNDPNFATTVTNLIGSKVSKSGDTMTGALIISPTGASPSGLIISPGSETNLQNILVIDADNYLTITNVAGGMISTEDNSIERWVIGQCEINGGSGNFASLKVNNTGVSVSGHSHSSSDITNFNTSVSGLLPSVSGSGFVNSSFANNTYTISVSGLQPSGNYSIVGHSHLSSDITNFNSSVSGLLPVKNIIGGSGIQVGSVSGEYTITAAGIAASSASSLITEVYNNTGSTIPKMSVVYINGGQGNLPTIALAIASGESGSNRTYGITTEAISPNNNGDVVIIGALIDVDTNQFGAAEGTTLYLSPTIPGGITTVKPLAPNHLVTVGTIVRNHNNQGVIEVRIHNGFELYELHDVKTSGVSDGQFLQYNGASGLWVPSSSGNFSTLQVNGTGVSVSGHSHSSSDITDFNSSVSGLLPSNIVTGVGTSGYLSRWNGTNSVTSGIIFDNGSRIGIGTTTPSGLLDVAGDVYIRGTGNNLGTAYFKSSSGSDTSHKIRVDTNGNLYLDAGPFFRAGSQDGAAEIQATSTFVRIGHGYNANSINQNIQFRPANTERMRITSDGNVGIGTSTPTRQLHIIGTGLIASTTGLPANALLDVYSTTSGEMVFNVEGTNGSLFSVIDNLSGSLMSVNNNAGLPIFEVFSDDSIVAGRFNQNDFFISSGGNIGIGKAIPSVKLDIVGGVAVSGAFAATTKSFKIDHPSKPNYTLEYGSLESPYHGVRLTGRGVVSKGKGIVELPDYLKDLIHNDDSINIQLTNLYHDKILYVSDIDLLNNKFEVAAKRAKTLSNLEFCWTLTGIRKDVEHLQVERNK